MAEPIVPVGLFTPEGFKLYDFLVDSGADLTLLPKSLAREMGVDVARCPKSVTQGVEEGRGVKIYYAKIRIRIGEWDDDIRCAFANHDRIPPLLGRLDLFPKYNITFHAKRRSVIFQRALPGGKRG